MDYLANYIAKILALQIKGISEQNKTKNTRSGPQGMYISKSQRVDQE